MYFFYNYSSYLMRSLVRDYMDHVITRRFDLNPL
jgi:hypothetical protein